MKKSIINNCRCCGSKNIIINSNKAAISPFFAKRVHGIYLPTLAEYIQFKITPLNTGIKKIILILCKVILALPYASKLFSLRSMPMVDFFICKECYFSSPTKEYQDHELASLYIGYRGVAYNEERIQLEPEYKKISAFIGNDIYEINSRQANINLLLKTTGLVHKVKSLIDWGGGDGRFVPELLSNKKVYVYDISGEKIFNKSFVSISDCKLLPQVDYIQVCHVLEHVGDPRGLLIDVLNNLKSGGFLYIEVPVDREVDEIKDMIANYDLAKFVIHEHINLFSDISIKKLGENVGLEVLSVNTTSIKLSRGYAKIISALFQKN